MRLKELRKKLNITQAELAKFLCISQNTYSYWETGKTKIDNNSIAKLADYFGVTADYLLGREVAADIRKQLPEPELSARAKHLLRLYEALDEHDQGAVLGYVEALIRNSKYYNKGELFSYGIG